MPKKKTGARKKAEKQKERQRGIRDARDRPITEYFCNVTMVGLGLFLVRCFPELVLLEYKLISVLSYKGTSH